MTYFEAEKLPVIRSFMFLGVTTLDIVKIPSASDINENAFPSSPMSELDVGTTWFNYQGFGNPTKLAKLTVRNAETLEANTFKSKTLLEEIHLPVLHTLSGNAFEDCSLLRVIDVPNLRTLSGDRHFFGCTSMQSFSLTRLETVDPASAEIFKGCIAMTEISLGSVPPKTFNKAVFENRGTGLSPLTLNLPLGGLSRYDKNTDIEDDVAGDGYWCGLHLTGTVITVSINGNELTGYSLEDIINENTLAAETITDVEFKSGAIGETDLAIIKTFQSLSSLKIPANVRITGNSLPASFLEDHQSISTIEIACTLNTVGEKALKGCSKLSSVSLSGAKSLSAEVFSGIPAEKIELVSVTTITGGNVFSNCPNLKTISLPALLECSASIDLAVGSPLIQTVTLPSTPPKITNSFLFSGKPKAQLPKSDDYLTYDLADSVLRDGKFYSLELDYSIIKVSFDSKISTGYMFSNALEKTGVDVSTIQNVIVLEGNLMKSDFPLTISSLKSFTVYSTVTCEGVPSAAFEGYNQLSRVDIQSKAAFVLGDSCFKECRSLSTAILKASELQGDSHFENCVQLTRVSLPSLLTVKASSISVFRGCSLMTIELGTSVPSFNKDTFKGMDISLVLPNYDSYVDYDNSLVVEGDKKDDSMWCGIKLPIRSFTVLINNHESVGESMSDAIIKSGIQNWEIETIQITKGVLKTSELSGFKTNYPSLKSFTVINTVNVIGDLSKESFAGSSIEEIEISNLKAVGEGALSNCGSLNSASFPEATLLSANSFLDCPNLVLVSLPNVKELSGDSHFKNSAKLESIDLSSLTTVPSDSQNIFNGCTSKLTLRLPSIPPPFNRNVFSGCNIYLELPTYDDYKSYDESVDIERDKPNDFLWCSVDLIQLYMKASINNAEAVNAGSFADAVKIDPAQVTSIVVNGGMVHSSEMSKLNQYPALHTLIIDGAELESSQIPSNAFYGMTHLTIVHIQWEVSIGSSAFEGCTSLSDVSFGSVTSVSSRAFAGSDIESIDLGGCSKVLGSEAFEGCANLKTVNFSSLSDIDSNYKIFGGCSNLKTLTLPSIPPKLLLFRIPLGGGLTPP